MFNATWQVMLELSPWLLLGMVAAGLLHWLVPASLVQRHFEGKRGVIKAVLLGIPMPLCSCAVIPAGIGLKKDGASDGASVGFLISTPQTGVDSIMVSAAMLGWPFAIFKVVSALGLGLVGGLGVDRLTPKPPSPALLPMASGQKRRPTWRESADHSMEILKSIWRWMAFGVLLSAAISTFVVGHPDLDFAALGPLMAALAALVVSLPLYVCATASVPIAAALIAAGLPTGAALVFLMAGPATNLATVGAILRTFGAKVLSIYLTTIVIGSVALSLLFDRLLTTTSSAHTHAHEDGAWWAFASAALLTILFLKFAFEELQSWLQKRARKEMKMDLVLKVNGMTCGGCSSRLEKVLERQPGVTAARVDLERGEAIVKGEIEEQALRQVILNAGFEPL